MLSSDLVQTRLDIAKKMGADQTLLIGKQNTDEAETVKKIHELCGGEPDKTIEASGAQSSIRLAILVSFPFIVVSRFTAASPHCSSLQATKSGGVAVLVGMGPPEVKVPLINALIREVDIRGVFRYANEYVCLSLAKNLRTVPDCILFFRFRSYADTLDLLSARKIDVTPLITHHYKLEETVAAFETSKSGQGVIKVMIHCK